MAKIKKVLIANRGEIALRIIRACKEMGIQTLQVYSEADMDSLPVKVADQAVCIGPARSSESYLNMKALLSTALTYGADAIHPGYGYLAENAEFARLCQKEGLAFIGPDPDVIELMGDKAKAREIAEKVGVPVTPGSSLPVNHLDQAYQVADAIGYPILIKASAGGGGRGMKVVRQADELRESL
jgi:acetyl-CoA carboxylase biotin carboxylase subunit